MKAPTTHSTPPCHPPKPLGLRARKQNWTRATIWEAAIDLFAEKGFDAVTIDEIADAARVSRRSFFRYFESKSDLMALPIANLTAAITKAVDACPRSMPAGLLLQQVVVAVAAESAADPRTTKVMEIVVKCASAREALTSRLYRIGDQIEGAFARRYRDPLLAQALGAMTLSALSLASRHWLTDARMDIGMSTRKVLASMAKATTGLDQTQR